MAQNKKTIVSFILLLSITMGLVLPQIASALSFTQKLKNGFVIAMTAFPLGISKLASSITGLLLGWVISDDAIKVRYTPGGTVGGDQNQVVTEGWRVVRDLANMMIVLGFVIVGIATILRLREYEAQKLLAPLIIVAILVNFSPLLCGIIIDASNIVMKFFLKGQVLDLDKALGSFGKQFTAIWDYTGEDMLGLFAMATGYILSNIVACITFALLFFLFLARYIMLWILVIFSPLAFVCYVFGFTKKYFQQWWSEFIKWCLVGIPAAFTLYLANMASTITLGSVPGGAASGLSGVITNLVTFSLPAMIMLVGFMYTLKFSGAGSAIAMGAAAAVGGFALGAVKSGAGAMGGLAKGGLRATGATGVGSKISSAIGTRMEKMGLKETGSTTQRTSQQREEAKKKLSSLDSDRLAKVAESKRESESTKAAAAEILASRGDFSKISAGKRETVAVRAMSQGVLPSVFERSDPTLAQYNKQKMAGFMNPVAKGGLGLTRDQAKDRAIDEAYAKLDVPAIRNLSAGNMGMDLIRNISAKKINKAGEEMSQEKVNRLRSLLPNLRALRYSAGPSTPTGKQLTEKINAIDGL